MYVYWPIKQVLVIHLVIFKNVYFLKCYHFTLLYIANHLSYKSRNDLNIYEKPELESTFIEVINPQKNNIIIGSIYRHPSMDLDDFNKNFLNKHLEKVSKEQKSVYLLGDFNVNLLNYNDHPPY